MFFDAYYIIYLVTYEKQKLVNINKHKIYKSPQL